ncbi:hypothetical protein K438DRAFT_1871475, partial [Mycena galopus ATCC 62051]
VCVSCLCLWLSLSFSSFAYHFLFPSGLLLLLLLLFSFNLIPYSCSPHPAMLYVVKSGRRRESTPANLFRPTKPRRRIRQIRVKAKLGEADAEKQ